MKSPSRGAIAIRMPALADSQLDEDACTALRRGHAGFVFQSFQLMPHLSASENMMLPLELTGAA